MIDDIRNWFGDIASGKIKDAHLALSEAKAAEFSREINNLQASLEDSKLREKKKDIKIADLEAQLSRVNPPGFIECNGLLWKRTTDGFEKRPYCPECERHPVMSPFAVFWTCPANHTFDLKTEPPKA